MQELQKQGVLRSIGVSNYDVALLEEVVNLGGAPPQVTSALQNGTISFSKVNQVLITPRYPQNDLLRVAFELGMHLQVFQRTWSRIFISSLFFCTRYNQKPPPTQAYSSLGSSSQSALMRNSLVNSIGRNLDVSPAQVADLLYIGHFFRKFFNKTSQTQGSLALGNPARPQCASKVHKVNYNSFHCKKV